MPSLKHYPDKPWERGPKDIPSLDNGQNICQQKTDGWRCELLKSRGIYAISRHNKPLDLEPHIREQVDLLLEEVPDRSQFDGEWLSRREATNKKAKPRLVLFDTIRLKKRWNLLLPYQERLAQLEEIFARAIDKHGADAFTSVMLPETALDGEFLSFYEAQKVLPHSEGVVIKRKNSTLVGDRNKSVKNANWAKVRYRAASSGSMTMDHLR